MQSSDYRENGNEAIKRGDNISAWQHYTEGLQVTPKDPYLWCNRAFACLKAGYPELALHDSANCEAILLEYPEQDFNDDNLIKLRFKEKYRMAEAYSVLGLPKHAAVEYKACLDLANKDPSMRGYTKSDYKMWEKKKDAHYKTSLLNDDFLEKIQVIGKRKQHGFYKFDKRYPWDKRYEERASDEMIEKLQKLLDPASNNLLKISRTKFDDSEQLGIFAKNTVSKARLTLQEDPFLISHNYLVHRCDYCFHELKEPNTSPYETFYQNPKQKDPYYCPKRSCNEAFCSEKCHKLSWNLYHKVLCGKDEDIKKIANIVHSDTIGVLHHLMMTVRLFAVAKVRDICPLDIEEIKHFSRFTPVSVPYREMMIYDPLLYDIYLIILRILEISRFDLRYDFWVFITIINIVSPNAFPGPGDLQEIDTLALYQLSSLVNHNCTPNVTDAQYLSQDYDSSPGPIRDNMRLISRINDVDKSYHPARIFFIPTRDVNADEQIFKSYCDPSQHKLERQVGLVTSFGFICKCERCQFEPGEAKQAPINYHLHFPVLPDWVKKYYN